MRRLIEVVLISSIAVMLWGCASTVRPSVTGRIVFSGYRDGGADIYTINLDGSDLQRVSDLPGYELNPTWSPDGSQIVFASNDNGRWSLHIVNKDGTNLRELFRQKGVLAETPAWSPDGKHIAFAANRKICTISPDGTNYTCLENIQHFGVSPVWSPDGYNLAFTALYDGPADNAVAYVVRTTGDLLRPLTTNEVSNVFVDWSPDGSRWLLFRARSQSDKPWGFYTMRTDGSDQQFFFKRGGGGASWSPDGHWLVLSAPTDETEKHSAIYIIRPDGTDLTAIPTGFEYATAPAWRPDK